MTTESPDITGGLTTETINGLGGLGVLNAWSTPDGASGLYLELDFNEEFTTASEAYGVARALLRAAEVVADAAAESLSANRDR